METNNDYLPFNAFQRATRRVPAYQTLLREAKIDPANVKTLADFHTLPVLRKASTFQRFGIEELCLDGELGDLASVLTSSGHSGKFAFGLNDAATAPYAAAWIDAMLDQIFAVKSKKTLLINCLPMGVKVPTQACTLAEVSVRPDMAIALVKSLGRHYAQIILVGDAAFLKHLLELGIRSGVDWKSPLVQIIVGEETLAENARGYLESLLGIDPANPQTGIVASSMGVGEVGLNLFSEVPPLAPLIALRRLFHGNATLRKQIFGNVTSVPSIFVYDPGRIFVEFDESGRLILTTLSPHLRIPLIRYATGDQGGYLTLPDSLREQVEALGIPWELLKMLPIVFISGRGDFASAGEFRVYPEEAKEGIYSDHRLAALTTANFRLVSGPEKVRIRIQLSPGIKPTAELDAGFFAALKPYVPAPIEVICEPYETFGSGMLLDYERKFAYLAP